MLQIAYIVTDSSSKRRRRCYELTEVVEVERRGLFWAGLLAGLVALAYAVPYLVLSGVDAWYGSFLFWVVFGLAAVGSIAVMTRGWRD